MDKQTYEEKKREREEKRASAGRASKRDRSAATLKNYALALVVAGLVGFGIYLLIRGSLPEGEDLSRAVPVMETAEHIASGGPAPEYNSNPPTSGPHYGQTAQSGFREEAIPDGHIIHNLEHGDVWISYHPRVPDAIKEEMKRFAAAKVIITPREANDADIALVAWGRLDTFNVEDGVLPAERIEDFIKRHMYNGPERITGASGGI